jgi:hypothetical protein
MIAYLVVKRASPVSGYSNAPAARPAEPRSAPSAPEPRPQPEASQPEPPRAPPPPEPRRAPPLSEEEKIDRLIKGVADSGIVFIRNGTEHTAAQAADHLRTKRKYAGDKIKTAKDFIEQLATRSSLSGKPYMVRTGDGKETPAGQWLTERLRTLESAGAEK